MKRKVLILTNPGKVGEANYCSGVHRDQENYFAYFKEPFGGYWSASELKHIDKPSLASVRKELSTLEQDDIEFSIIIFCGHGWFSSKSNSNILVLNDAKEEIDSLELRTGANKRIIILDSCREVHDQYISESLIKALSTRMLSDREGKRLNAEDCKMYYNRAVSDAPKQILISFACNLSEVANESPAFGGYYSSSLIKASKDWADNTLKSTNIENDYSVARFPTSHMESIPLVHKLNGNQNPQIEKARLMDSASYLPFVVVA